MDGSVLNGHQPLLVIVGPTAAGKSSLALKAAVRLNGEIVSADSVQVYRGLDIGSAKPSHTEQNRIKHWCIDVVDPGTTFDAASWVRHATDAITDISRRGRVPIVVGGTGFYIRALLTGLHHVEDVDPAIRKAVREELAKHGPETMHAELQQVDPAAAQRISRTDPQRIGRALEVYRSTGKPLSGHFNEERPNTPYNALTIGLWPPREVLYESINTRAGMMLNQGLVDEVRLLIEQGINVDEGPLTALGYRQVVQHLRDEIPTARLHEAIATAHRQYARRQLTWFRGITTRENNLRHIDPTMNDPLETVTELWRTQIE